MYFCMCMYSIMGGVCISKTCVFGCVVFLELTIMNES